MSNRLVPGSIEAQQRTLAMGVVLTLPLAIGLWFFIDRSMPPIPGMATQAARFFFALHCVGIAALLALLPGIEAVAHERLVTPAIDPLAGAESRRMRVNQRYVQNTIEQLWLFVPGLLMLAVQARDGGSMRAVVACTIVWTLARWVFWIGYLLGPRFRSAGLVGMVQSMMVLLYCVGRFGYVWLGWWGAVALIAPFALAELFIVGLLRWESWRAQEEA
jgi:membrane protein YdbS with pleckstrin-like domain